MNKKAYTLIELMIVIAILGIILPFSGFKNIIKEYDYQNNVALEQKKVFFFQKALRKYLKEAKTFNKVNSRKIVTDNFYLEVSKDRTQVNLNGKITEFKKFRIENFRLDDNNSVICDIKNQNTSFKLYLVPGK